MNLKEKVDNYLLENLRVILDDKLRPNFRWSEIAEKIGKNINAEYVRGRWRKLINSAESNADKFLKGEGVQSITISGTFPNTSVVKYHLNSGKEDKVKGTKEFTFTTSEIPTEAQIIEHFNIDTKRFKINQIYHKTSFGGKYAITVSLLALKGAEAENYTDKFDKFIESYNKKINTKVEVKGKEVDIQNDVLYLVSLSDLHIGNYQKEGYLEQLKNRVFQTFKSIAETGVKKIIILNTGDMLHTNGSNEQTQQGTQLDSQEPFEDAFTQGLELTTSLIDYASLLSLSVTYINVRGNHSFDTEYCLGEALKKIYQKSNNIEILNQRDTRIYYYWNNNAFLFTHGDKAVERLPLLFATEGKDFFNKAENHHILLGHTHHNSSKQFVNDRKEYAGIEVRVLGSPTSNDIWHKQNGFTNNKKSIVSMLFTPEEGKYAEFNFKLFR